MSVIDLVIVVVGLAFVLLLVRASKTLSRNPYQQIRAHEELIGERFPAHMTHREKLNLIDRFGFSPAHPERIWSWVVVVAVALAVLVWQR
jgi:hypothetical protein